MTATLTAPVAAPHRLALPEAAPPLRWGVVGSGDAAEAFARSVLSHTRSRIVAVASRDSHRSNLYAKRYEVPVVRSGEGAVERLAEDPSVEAVYVATPHSEHRAHALNAIAAGKHVLVEKAFARNQAEAREVVDAARVAGVFVMEAMWTRFLPHMVEARRLVDEGAIGSIVHVSADFGRSREVDRLDRFFNPNLAGGALLDLGVYPISLIHDFLGAPESIRAVGALAPTGVDLREAIILDYPSRRAMGTAMSTFEADTGRFASINGTRGRIDFGPLYYRPTSLTLVRAGRRDYVFDPGTELGWQYQVAAFARCVDEGRIESDIMPHAATLEVLRVMDEARSQLGVGYPGE